jgi:orotidine-5'-phosphate decarboxylase
MDIIEKYNKRAKKINSLLCVGLDADYDKLPEKYKKLKGSSAQFEFNKYIIDSTSEYASAFKPNIAFYEARGIDGMEALKKTIDYINKNYPDIFTILDAKRADIGNTNNGYVTLAFDWLSFNAVTINPYLGQEAVQPFLDRKDKCSIVLCRTSNKGAGELQDLKIIKSSGKAQEKPLWQIVAEKVSKNWNKNKNCMLVVGATYPKEMKKIRSIVSDMTFLVPGVGAQGGEAKQIIRAGLNRKGLGLIINSARGIIFSKNPKEEARKLRDEINLYR